MRKRLSLIMFLSISLLVVNSVRAGSWSDDFSDGWDGYIDLSNYVINQPSGGKFIQTELPLGFMATLINNQVGSYILTAVKVEHGDVVRTKYNPVGYWTTAGIAAVGLTYDLSGRSLDSGVSFLLQDSLNNVKVFKSVEGGTVQEGTVMPGVGDPIGQDWIYEQVVGSNKGDDTFDVVCTVYNASGTQIGSSVTVNMPMSVGDLYWYTGDSLVSYSKTYWVTINMPDPPALTECEYVRRTGFRLSADFDGNCEVDLRDFSMLASKWLECIDNVDTAGCSQPW